MEKGGGRRDRRGEESRRERERARQNRKVTFRTPWVKEEETDFPVGIFSSRDKETDFPKGLAGELTCTFRTRFLRSKKGKCFRG